jgi:hypothetical protein
MQVTLQADECTGSASEHPGGISAAGHFLMGAAATLIGRRSKSGASGRSVNSTRVRSKTMRSDAGSDASHSRICIMAPEGLRIHSHLLSLGCQPCLTDAVSSSVQPVEVCSQLNTECRYLMRMQSTRILQAQICIMDAGSRLAWLDAQRRLCIFGSDTHTVERAPHPEVDAGDTTMGLHKMAFAGIQVGDAGKFIVTAVGRVAVLWLALPGHSHNVHTVLQSSSAAITHVRSSLACYTCHSPSWSPISRHCISCHAPVPCADRSLLPFVVRR